MHTMPSLVVPVHQDTVMRAPSMQPTILGELLDLVVVVVAPVAVDPGVVLVIVPVVVP